MDKSGGIESATIPSPALNPTPITGGKNEMQRSKSGKLSWYLKAPVRALTRLKELYVTNLIRCADGGFGRGVSSYTGTVMMPRSYSTQSMRSESSMNDFRELVRINSRMKMSELNINGSAARTPVIVPRSQSVAVKRIDEDKPMEFDDDEVTYLRSKSAVPIARRKMRV